MFCYSTKDPNVLLNISVQISFESENKSVNKQISIIHLFTLSANYAMMINMRI